MGWGYKGTNVKGQHEKVTDGLNKVLDNEKLKVYSSMNNIFYAHTVSVRVLFNKENKTIKVIVSGVDAQGERISPITKDVTELKYLKNIKLEIINLLDEFKNPFKNSTEVLEVENLSNKDFLNSLNDFFSNLNNLNTNDRMEIWNKFYKDMFNRTSLFDNYEISLQHEKYLSLIGA